MHATPSTIHLPAPDAGTRHALDLLSAGATLGDVVGFDPGKYEGLYALGYELYQSARYDDAACVFGVLATHNHLEPRYLFAYASALQMNGDWGGALRMYELAASHDLTDPVPHFHMAECYLALGMNVMGRTELAMALDLSKVLPEHADLHTRVNAVHALVTPREATASKEKPE